MRQDLGTRRLGDWESGTLENGKEELKLVNGKAERV
jgi:hypothetical protein